MMGNIHDVGPITSFGSPGWLYSSRPYPLGPESALHGPESSAATRRVNKIGQASPSPTRKPEASPEDGVVAAEESRSTRYAQLAVLWERIQDFTRMRHAGMLQDAVPVQRATVYHVRRLLIGLPIEVDLPQATASCEGEVGLTWFKGENRLDAIIAADGYLSWACRIGNEFFEGDVLELSPSQTLQTFYKAVASFYE